MAIAGYLKQSTAVTIKVGPFVDETDGKTAETSLTISQADVRLSKNGGNMAQKNESTALSHDEIGMYDCPLDTTDTNTLGILTVNVHESGALPVRLDYMVVPANVYDSLVGGTDNLQVDTVQVEGSDATNQIRDSVVDDSTRIDASALNAATGTSIPAILADTNELQTDDIPGRLDSIDTDLGNIETDTQDIQSRLPAALTGAGNIKADVLAIEGSDPTDTIDNVVTFNGTLANISAAILALTLDLHLDTGTVGNTGNDSTHVHLDGNDGYGDDDLNDNLLVIKDATTDLWYTTWITDFVGATDLATVETLPFTPASGDSWRVLTFKKSGGSSGGGDATEAKQDQIISALGTVDSNVDAIKAVTDALPDSGALTSIAQEATLGSPAGTSLAADIAAIKSETADILADTNELQTDDIPGSLTTLSGKIDTIDNVVDAILIDTAEIGAAGAGLTEAGGTGDHLTAINLPDQTMNITGNITGNLSGSVGSVTGNVGGNVVGSIGSLAAQAKADVNAEADTALSDYDPPTKAELDAAQAAIIDGVLDAVRISKNTELANFAFFMRDSSDHVSPKTGLTITSERSIDGGAFAATANSASEISDGFYKITLAATDLNGDVIALRFSASGADDTVLTLITQPKD